MFSTQTNRPDEVERSCANPAWVAPLLFAMGYLVWAYHYAWTHGNFLELTGLPNGEGLVCGVSETVADKPYLYLCPDGAVESYTNLVCVAQCPVSIEGSVAKGACPTSPAPDYPSIPVADKACFPTDKAQFLRLVHLSFRFGMDSFLSSIVEVQKAWPVFVLSGALTILLSYGWLKIFSSDPQRVFWFATGIFTTVVGACGIWSVSTIIELQLTLGDPWGCFSSIEFMIGALGIVSVILYHLAIQFERHNLESAFQAMKASGECVRDVPVLLAEPMISSARKVFLLINFALAMLLFISDFEREPISGDPTKNYEIKYETKHILIASGFVFAFGWVFEFSNAVSCFVYGYIAEVWFYSPQDDAGVKDMKPSLLFEAYLCVAKYHLGSLAYGSLVLFITRPMRMVLDYATRPVRKADDDDSNLCVKCTSRVRCWARVCDRVIQVYENYFRGLRRSAFMDMAMNGKEFWDASQDADWFLAGKNVNMAQMDGAAALASFAGACCISACGAALTRLLCGVWPDYSSTSSPNYIMLPMFVSLISFIICFLITWPFCLMPDHVVDSIFFCFCVDRKSYGIGLSVEERDALNRGCNFQTLWGSTPSISSPLTRASHPPETQELFKTFTSLQ